MTWRLHTQPQSIIGHILNVRYFPSTDFFDSQLGSKPSFTWRSFHTASDLENKRMKWGGGQNPNVGWNSLTVT